MTLEIPVIDVSCLSDPNATNSDLLDKCSSEVYRACHTVGFLYLVGHGMSDARITESLGLVNTLFNLDDTYKEAVDARNSSLSRGYNSYLQGRHSCTPKDGTRDLKESFTVGVDCRPGDCRPPSAMHGPNLWPSSTALPGAGWREAVEEVFSDFLAASRLLMQALALALQLPRDYFTSQCDDPVAQMVMFRYPPSTSRQERGCGAHTDCGFLTLLAQDSPGIEVQTKSGEWVAAPPKEGALLVNLGDMAAQWTNDEFKSTVHRVVNRGDKPRTSLVFFCNCNYNAVVQRVPSLPGPDKYAPTLAGDYILQKLGLMQSG